MIDTRIVRNLQAIESVAVIPRVASTNLIARRIVTECIENELSLPQAIIIAGEQFMTVYKPIQPLAEGAAELAVAVANGEEPSADLVTGETDNGTEAVPTVVIDTIAVTAENVADTIVADEVYPVDEICAGQYAAACKDAGIN